MPESQKDTLETVERLGCRTLEKKVRKVLQMATARAGAKFAAYYITIPSSLCLNVILTLNKEKKQNFAWDLITSDGHVVVRICLETCFKSLHSLIMTI